MNNSYNPEIYCYLDKVLFFNKSFTGPEFFL